MNAELSNNNKKENELVEHILINNVSIGCKIGTGAQCNMLPAKLFGYLSDIDAGRKHKMQTANVNLIANGGTKIEVIEREPIPEIITANTTSNIGLTALAAHLFDSQILAPIVTEANPIIVIEPNRLEVNLLATSTTTISSPKPGCSSWFADTEIYKTPGTPKINFL
ncbi:hypothetical protein HHI36_017710 [Cryptolaemus montrouzieri]|uniref:Uncharacterized protein n=1 Tax=Cryptolaemus montrouzieri TaxID=559131 RepID=A0ABD2NNN4_9CUCU